MDKEQIEQAAREYRNTLPYCDDPKVRGMSIGGYDGFIAGAEWRINFVWHTPEEKPVCKNEKLCEIFFISKKGYPHANTYSEDGFFLYNGYNWSDVKCWAYVDDLLPRGGAK